jgi:single-strand DNA-binding protein
VRNSVPICVVGNLTDDPELRFTSSGAAMTKFTIAVNPRFYDKASGEWKDGDASFYRCTAWRGLAENLAESLKRGHRVVLAGTIAERRWQDTTDPTKTRSAWEVTAEAVGPDLTYAQASVRKMARGSRDEIPPDDAWATASPTAPTSAGDVEPPF